MVRFYQRAIDELPEESRRELRGIKDPIQVIERIERELELRELHMLGIDNEYNIVVVKRGREVEYIYAEAAGSVIEVETGPFRLVGVDLRDVYQQGGQDAAIEFIERELKLRGVYVLGQNKDNNFVIVHKGRTTKDIYLRIFGYGPRYTDDTGTEVNLCP